MLNVSLNSLNLKKLNRKEIYEINKLKNSFWKYGLKNNLIWFKKNVLKDDIHVILKFKKKIIGYNLLRKRNFYYNSKKKNYYYFDTLIIDEKYRRLNLAKKILKYNNEIFKEKKSHSFLICKKKHEAFYKKFNWVKINNSKFVLKDHIFLKEKFIGMVNNLNQYTFKNKKMYCLNK